MIGVQSLLDVRLVVLCFAAIALSLPMAWISLAKLALAIVCFLEIARVAYRKAGDNPVLPLQSAPWILSGIVIVFLSLAWTSADPETASQSLVKHSKLVFILLPSILVRNLRNIKIAWMAFAAGQVFLLASAWLLVCGVPVPWAVHNGGKFAVFSTYLDQSIIFATSAAIFWHLRLQGIWSKWLAYIFSVCALLLVMVLLEGRTGLVVAVTMIGLAAAWSAPVHLRRQLIAVTAVLLLGSVYLVFDHAKHEVPGGSAADRNYTTPGSDMSSDQWRLNAWHRSIQAVEAAPLIGGGAGGWKNSIQVFEGPKFLQIFGTSPISNPHQQYLLWAVEFGLAGLLVHLLGLAFLARDARKFEPSIRHALWSVLTACVVSCMFNSSLYDDLIGDFFCLTLGLLCSLGLQQKTVQEQYQAPHHPLTTPVP